MPDITSPLRSAPGRREVVLVLGLVFVLYLTFGTALQVINARVGVLATEILFIALPAIAAVRLFYLDPRAVLPFHRPEARHLAAAILGAVSLNLLLQVYEPWQERVAPTPEWIQALFANLFEARSVAEFAFVLLCLALVPALCEEMLFRGFVQAGVAARAASRSAGIALVAFLFAAFHLDPWRFTGVFALGLFLGWLRLESGSLWPPIVAHAVFNALSIGLVDAGLLSDTGVPGTPVTALLAGVGCAAALALMRPRSARPPVGRVL